MRFQPARQRATSAAWRPPLRRLLIPALAALCALSGCVTTSNPWAHVPSKDAPPPTLGAASPARLSPAAASPAVFPAAGKTAPALLTLGQEVDWVFENAPDKRGVVRAGRAQVGPDGTMVVGPYGHVAVAGLTEAQAARRVEGLLKAEFKNPRVHIQAPPPLTTVIAPGATLVWHKSGSGDVMRASKDDAPLVGPELGPPPALDPKTLDPKMSPPIDPKFEPGPPIEFHAHDGPPVAGPVSSAAPYLHHGKMKGFAVHPDAPSEMNPTLLPAYVIGPPDVLLVQSRHALLTHPIQGQHLVRPDGSIGLSIYGAPIVAGLTIEQAREAIARVINPKLKLPKEVDEKTGKVTAYFEPEEQLKEIRNGLVVDVLAYNSKVYYVITDGGGYGEQVVRLPVTGGETVLDAISQVNGLSPVSSKFHVWIARRTPGHGGPDSVLRVDWIGITQRGATATNYQIMPGDRLYVKADRWRAADAAVAKVLAPFERILGVTLLGSQTVNSIRNRGTSTNP